MLEDGKLVQKDGGVLHSRIPSSIVLTGGQVSRKGLIFTLRTIIQALWLDLRAYGNRDDRVSAGDVFGWFLKYPDIYLFAYSCGLDYLPRKLLGYMNMMSLTDEAFARIKDGCNLDKEIEPADLLIPLLKGDEYKLYICSVNIRNDAINMTLGRLLQRFAGRLINDADEGIYYSEVLVDAVTEEGFNTAMNWPFLSIGKSKKGSTLLHLRLLPPPLDISHLDCEARKVRRFIKVLLKYKEYWDRSHSSSDIPPHAAITFSNNTSPLPLGTEESKRAEGRVDRRSVFRMIAKEYDLSIDYTKKDPASSLAKLRYIMEAVCVFIGQEEGISVEPRHGLGANIETIRHRLPAFNECFRSAKTIQGAGNEGSHFNAFQGEGSSVELLTIAHLAMRNVLRWLIKEYPDGGINPLATQIGLQIRQISWEDVLFI